MISREPADLRIAAIDGIPSRELSETTPASFRQGSIKYDAVKNGNLTDLTFVVIIIVFRTLSQVSMRFAGNGSSVTCVYDVHVFF